MKRTDKEFDQIWSECYSDGLADTVYGVSYGRVYLLFLMVQRQVANLRAFIVYNVNASPQMHDGCIWN